MENLLLVAVPASPDHPLAAALLGAAQGRFPAVDGCVEVVAPDRSGAHAVVEFTGHSFVLTDLPAADAVLASIDAFGGATQPRVLTHLAGPCGSIGSLDVVMVRRIGPATTDPLDQIDGSSHPRVTRALHHRRDVTVLGDERGVVTVGTGLVDRREISIELTEAPGSTGAGRQLLAAALSTSALLAPDEYVFAQVAPGNAASVRMFLACGFVPIGSEVLIERRS